MTTLLGCLNLTGMLLASASVSACSLVRLSPADMFEASSAAVIAAPVAVSYRPKLAAITFYPGSFEQSVVWRVSRRFKGGFGTGDTISTAERIDRNDLPCGVSTEVRGQEERLVYVFGEKSPFRVFSVRLDQAGNDLQALGAEK